MNKYALVKDGVVANVVVWDGNEATWQAPAGHIAVIADEFVSIGWGFDGQKFSAPGPEISPPSDEEITAQKVALVQEHMDAAARALNYDSIANAITYADEPAVPKFQAEGLAFRAWRSLVWERCYEILEQVQNGERAIPSDEELIAELPALALPTA
ncbi:hypothetical protein [Achromobacter arsenitoxydans]|uniref:Putative phage tail fiber protein n=1 Tax=Achromobacter arsenitoxydans SY8 TaxID=477184 RepID=H0F6V0_9BURK|nr:hypothetical protein [Achromobacter arsenitoxydans]EHK66008.1 putative phage tail fiber protein [Achromobacter arsenitoxydans SY8]